MKHIFMAVVFTALAFPAFAQEPRDGNHWRTMPESWRLGYIQGTVEGWDMGAMVVGESLKLSSSRLAPSCADRATDIANNEFDAYLRDVSVRELRDGMDTFYNDARNRLISMPQAFFIVTRQIRGEDMDRYIEVARRDAQ